MSSPPALNITGPEYLKATFTGWSFFEWSRKHHSNQVVAAAGKVAPADGFILDELCGRAVHAYFSELKVA